MPPTNYLECDGSSVSRTTYAGLLSSITQTQSCTTSNTSANLTVVSSVNMLGSYVEGTGIPSNTYVASITNSTTVVLSQAATASATVNVVFFNWGNGNGSSTFNIPDLRAYVTAGQGSELVGQTVANSFTSVTSAGQLIGAQTITIAGANLPVGVPVDGGGGTSGNKSLSNSAAGSDFNVPFNQSNAYGAGSGTAMTLVQPTAIVTKCIKYI